MKALRYLIGIAAVVAVSLVSSYLFQYPLFNLYPEKVSVTGVVVLLFICGAFILIIEGALILLNKRFKWYSGHEVAKVIFITGLLYSALMIFVFPYIEVPYSWIPPRGAEGGRRSPGGPPGTPGNSCSAR